MYKIRASTNFTANIYTPDEFKAFEYNIEKFDNQVNLRPLLIARSMTVKP